MQRPWQLLRKAVLVKILDVLTLLCSLLAIIVIHGIQFIKVIFLELKIRIAADFISQRPNKGVDIYAVIVFAHQIRLVNKQSAIVGDKDSQFRRSSGQISPAAGCV